MNEALWAMIREYIAAELALARHRMTYGDHIMTVEEAVKAYPISYSDEYEGEVRDKSAERAEWKTRHNDYVKDRAMLEAQSTRMETAVREASAASEERMKRVEEMARRVLPPYMT